MAQTSDLPRTLAHHDAAINALSSRMNSVEASVRTLSGEVHTGFASLASKLEKLDAQPRLDLSKAVTTVLSLSILFSMVVGGIVWVTTNQFAGLIAKQDSLNTMQSSRIDRTEAAIGKLTERLSWPQRVEPRKVGP